VPAAIIYPYPVAFIPETDNNTRMSAQTAKIEAGRVFLPRRAEWLGDTFEPSYCNFRSDARTIRPTACRNSSLGWISATAVAGWSAARFVMASPDIL
jgi:hypothetical protein